MILTFYLALKAFNQVTNCHSGGDGVGVDDDVWSNAFTCKRHILKKTSIKHSQNTQMKFMETLFNILKQSLLSLIIDNGKQ